MWVDDQAPPTSSSSSSTGPSEGMLPSPWESIRLQVRVDPYANIVAGGFGGALSLMVGFPLDTVKVRLQTMKPCSQSGAIPYLGTLDCVRKVVEREGFGGLYRGMSGLMLFSVPRFALIFYGYSVGLNLQQKGNDNRPSTALSSSAFVEPPGLFQVFLAGAFSQLLVVPFVVAPCERIKVLLQTQSPGSNVGQLECLKRVVLSHGIRRGLFRGTSLTYMRDIASFSVYFLTYEAMRRQMPRTKKPDDNPGDQAPFLGNGVLPTILAGGVAGFFGWLVAIPLDVLKNRHQSGHAGSTSETLRSLLGESGVWGLYRGAVPILLRALPANAAAFLGYEAAVSVMAKLRHV